MDNHKQQLSTNQAVQSYNNLKDNSTNEISANSVIDNTTSNNEKHIIRNDNVKEPNASNTKRKSILNVIKFVKWDKSSNETKKMDNVNLQNKSNSLATTSTLSLATSSRSSLYLPSSSNNTDTSSSTSSDDEDKVYISKAKPPDGGWGWVVVIASFFVNLIADGITFSFGIIYVDLLDYFGESKAKTAWIGSLFMAMPLLSGPIASFMTDRYGCRKVTIFGSFLAAFGFVISSFTESLELLIFTFGIISGFGLSLCFVAAVVIIAYYFDKRRSFATGLSLCGSGIGTFLFAPLTQYFLAEYGWRGTTLIFAGFILNLSICGALMRDLPWVYEKAKEKSRKLRKRRQKKIRERNYVEENRCSPTNISVDSPNHNSALQTVDEVDENYENEVNNDTRRLYSSVEELPTFLETDENVPLEVLELTATHKKIYKIFIQKYPYLAMLTSRSFSDSGRLNLSTPIPLSVTLKEHDNLPQVSKELNSSQISKINAIRYINLQRRKELNHRRAASQRNPKRSQDAFLKDVRLHRCSLTYRGAMLNINRYRLKASSCPDIYRNSMITLSKDKSEWYDVFLDFWYLFVDMIDFSCFHKTGFLFFSISNFLLYTWYDIPYMYLTDNALLKGYSQTDSSYLISVIGIVNMFGEIILGWVGDRKWANANIIYAFSMILCGVFIGIIPLVTNYIGFCIASGAFGFFVSANYSLSSIILVELISLERFTSAYGLLLLVQGIANLIGPPLAGWIYDITMSYDLSFYLSGLFIAVSGMFLFILPSIKRYKRFKNLSIRNALSPSRTNEAKRRPKFCSILLSCITGSIKNNKDVSFV